MLENIKTKRIKKERLFLLPCFLLSYDISYEAEGYCRGL